MKKLNERVSRSFLDFCYGFLYLMEAIFFSFFNDFEFFKKGEPFFTKKEIKEIESGQIFLQDNKKAKRIETNHGPPKLLQ